MGDFRAYYRGIHARDGGLPQGSLLQRRRWGIKYRNLEVFDLIWGPRASPNDWVSEGSLAGNLQVGF